MFKCLGHFIKKLYSHNFASKTHHIYFSHFPGILVEMYYIEIYSESSVGDVRSVVQYSYLTISCSFFSVHNSPYTCNMLFMLYIKKEKQASME